MICVKVRNTSFEATGRADRSSMDLQSTVVGKKVRVDVGIGEGIFVGALVGCVGEGVGIIVGSVGITVGGAVGVVGAEDGEKVSFSISEEPTTNSSFPDGPKALLPDKSVSEVPSERLM
jgi:hypothetical protein